MIDVPSCIWVLIKEYALHDTDELLSHFVHAPHRIVTFGDAYVTALATNELKYTYERHFWLSSRQNGVTVRFMSDLLMHALKLKATSFFRWSMPYARCKCVTIKHTDTCVFAEKLHVHACKHKCYSSLNYIFKMNRQTDAFTMLKEVVGYDACFRI